MFLISLNWFSPKVIPQNPFPKASIITHISGPSRGIYRILKHNETIIQYSHTENNILYRKVGIVTCELHIPHLPHHWKEVIISKVSAELKDAYIVQQQIHV
jgi:hypothetical protein